MARRIVVNCQRDPTLITERFVSETQRGFEEVLREFNAYLANSGSTIEENSGEITKMWSIEEGCGIVSNAGYSYRDNFKTFSVMLDILGNPKFWKEGSEIPRRLKGYFVSTGMNLYRDEIATNGGIKYVSGAETSGHMSLRHGVKLVKE